MNEMPVLSAYYSEFFELVETESECISPKSTFKVKCKIPSCKSKRTISVSKSSTRNLIRHLRTYHSEVLQNEVFPTSSTSSESAAVSLSVRRQTLKRTGNDGHINQKILRLIVGTLAPFSIIENENFIDLINTSAKRKVAIMSRPTLNKALQNKFVEMTSVLKNILKEIPKLCITADCWSAHRRSYLGVTCHWVTENLDRQSCVLACRRLQGSHTFDVLGKEIDNILKLYMIKDKVSYICTDNASNFVKLLRLATEENKGLFIALTNGQQSDDNVSDEDYNSAMDLLELIKAKKVDITDLMSLSSTDDIFITMPTHIRCASHTINLICTSDVRKSLQGEFKDQYNKIIEKCNQIWKQQNTSTLKADYIKQMLGKYFVTPGATRWNSLFDSLQDILNSLQHKKIEVYAVCSYLKIEKFSDLDVNFLEDICKTFEPVALALDILQGDHIFIGALIPIIYKVLIKLQNNSSPLSEMLQNGFKSRFSEVLNDFDFLIATALHPQFKIQFIKKYYPERVTDVEGYIISKLNSLSTIPTSCQTNNSNSKPSFWDSDEENEPVLIDGGKQILAEFEQDRIRTLRIFDSKRFESLKALFIKYNTALPSSGSVERLFSIGKAVLKPNRCNIKDEHFESQLLLHINKNYIS